MKSDYENEGRQAGDPEGDRFDSRLYIFIDSGKPGRFLI
jgi:hypothetical protein